MILAGIHGGYEWNTTKLATRLIELILEDPGLVPSYTTLFILPTLNIDGEARGHGPAGRANENGVDLNRNFPVHWKEDWPRTGCWQMGPITAGEFAISEPETAALVNFLKFHPINALISYHSAGLGIFPGGNQKDPHSIDLAETIARLSPYPYPPLDTGCEHTGTLVDFAVEQGIAAVDIELSTHWDTEIEVNLKVLQAFLKWTPDLEKDLPQLEP